jgi:Ricin-type beta-trefoil lectin domain-like
MSDQLIPDGTYQVRGPGGQLTIDSAFPGVAMLPPEGGPTQQWKVACASGTYTLRSVASELYLGNDGDPNDPSMIVKGAKQPFAWKLSTGEDSDETTYVLTSAASSEGLVLSMSLLRIFPPLVAILPPSNYSTVEWAFDRV